MRTALFLSFFVLQATAQLPWVPAPSPLNHPVSIVFELQIAHALPDGSTVKTTTHRLFYRDSEGRVRNDSDFASPGKLATTTNVTNSVDGEILHWFTIPNAPHTFNRIKMVIPPTPPPSGPPNAMARRRPLVRQAGEFTDPHGVKTKIEVPVQDYVAGEPCLSSRQVMTYPVGAIGNDRPIIVTSESCTSTEFGVVLREVRDDPRSGHQTTTMLSLDRREPDPSFFRPPAGYVEQVNK